MRTIRLTDGAAGRELAAWVERGELRTIHSQEGMLEDVFLGLAARGGAEEPPRPGAAPRCGPRCPVLPGSRLVLRRRAGRGPWPVWSPRSSERGGRSTVSCWHFRWHCCSGEVAPSCAR
jgi:hypothetical protein